MGGVMNYPHLHLMINHVPVLGRLLLAPAAAHVGPAVTRRRDFIRLSLFVALLAGLSVYPAFFTGDEAHEQLGRDSTTTWCTSTRTRPTGGSGIPCGGHCCRGRAGTLGQPEDRAVPRWAGTTAMVGLLLSVLVTARTAWLGGEIRHPRKRRARCGHRPMFPSQ